MAKTWIKATKQFTRRIGRQTVVGHPNHPDVRGRYAEVEEGEATDQLVNAGYASRVSRAEYVKAMESTSGDAGNAMLDQVQGRGKRASITMTDGQLAQMAADKKVDISKAKSRNEVVKLINGTDTDTGASSVPDNAFARTSGDTRDTTLHPPSSGVQSDVTGNGTTDRAGVSTTGVTSADDGSGGGEIAAEEAAPAGSGKPAAEKTGSGDGGGSQSQ